jgi:hypothetical protein
VSFDKAGRVMVSPDLLRHANIAKDAVLVGSLTKFNLYSPARWQQEEARTAGENFGDLMRRLDISSHASSHRHSVDADAAQGRGQWRGLSPQVVPRVGLDANEGAMVFSAVMPRVRDGLILRPVRRGKSAGGRGLPNGPAGR